MKQLSVSNQTVEDVAAKNLETMLKGFPIEHSHQILQTLENALLKLADKGGRRKKH